jgi:hypothetical protein
MSTSSYSMASNTPFTGILYTVDKNHFKVVMIVGF